MTRRKIIIASILVIAVLAAVPVLAGKKKKKKGDEAPEPEAQPQPTAEVVAYIGDEAITKDELDSSIGSQLAKIRQDEFDIRMGALDRFVAERLMRNEAAARGISLTELTDIEIEAKAGEPTEQEIDRYYEANKSRVRTLQNKSREQAGPDVRRILLQQKLSFRRSQFIAELRSNANIRILLDPPRADVPIPAGEPAKGPADAPVTIVEFSDFQCGYCKRAEPTVERLLAEYGDKIRLVYRDYPLAFHNRARPASVAARCAGDQGKYWEYHQELMKVAGDLGDDDLKKRAEKLELDAAAFAACYDGDRHGGAVDAAFQDGASLGVTGTPTFFINGRMIVGAKGYDEFKSIIEDELSRTGG